LPSKDTGSIPVIPIILVWWASLVECNLLVTRLRSVLGSNPRGGSNFLT
jgi:hypothetical protein